jgi:NADPH:quinone reductase-like Zn-dependent oxidoreductase
MKISPLFYTRRTVAATLFSALAAAALLAGGAALAQSGAQSNTIRQYQIEKGALVLKTAPRPVPKDGEVLVRMRAVSLNRRDLGVLRNQYGPGGTSDGRVPLSDGAGEVVAVGAGVTRFRAGDRVAGTFFANWVDGKRHSEVNDSARGGAVDGMLSEMIVSHEDGLVKIPDYMSFEEGSTLPCTGVTVWRALFTEGKLKPGEFVLLEGTGGVSSYGLLLAAAAGAKPIITSSSDDKLAEARKLGAVGTVNYRKNAEWQVEVRKLTGGAGVDHVLEIGGQDTLPKALAALANEGHVAMIGGLTGFVGEIPAGQILRTGAGIRGIYVGSRADFEALNAFMTEHEIHPLIDRVFPFDEAPAAYEFMDSGNFMGKIVIKF